MTKNTYNKNSKKKSDRPIRLWKLEPGSTCTIFAEPSRGIRRSYDTSVYLKAKEHEGFYATSVDNPDKAIVLMPEDLVYPLAKGA